MSEPGSRETATIRPRIPVAQTTQIGGYGATYMRGGTWNNRRYLKWINSGAASWLATYFFQLRDSNPIDGTKNRVFTRPIEVVFRFRGALINFDQVRNTNLFVILSYPMTWLAPESQIDPLDQLNYSFLHNVFLHIVRFVFIPVITSVNLGALPSSTDCVGSGVSRNLDMKFILTASIVLAISQALAQNAQNTTVTTLPSTSLPSTTAPTSSPIPFPTDSLYTRFVLKGKRYWGARIEYADFTANSASFDQRLAALLKTQYTMVYGETFIWHSQLPSWVKQITDPTILTDVIATHISALAGHWRGGISAWEVCSELFTEDGSFRQSVFYNVLRECKHPFLEILIFMPNRNLAFVPIAFKAARKSDNRAKLYIGDSVNAKLTSATVIIRVNGSVNILDGLKALADSGVSEVAIKDLEVANSDPDDYVSVVKACLAVSKCVGITSIGVRDLQGTSTMINSLLFDKDGRAKPAYTAIINALK
ncbi:glycoside hydrolase [Serendipita vermifera]|nr:glycoside hydrolase [Serendipita vermifera]